MPNKLLNLEVFNTILTDASYLEYLKTLISSILNIRKEHTNLELISYTSANSVNEVVKDIIDNSNDCLTSINIKGTKDDYSRRYIFRLFLNSYINEVANKSIELNIDDFDHYDQGDFMYHSTFIEEKYQIELTNLFEVIDINMPFLKTLSFAEISAKEPCSIERLLYPFICDNQEELEKLYQSNEIMSNLIKKLNTPKNK